MLVLVLVVVVLLLMMMVMMVMTMMTQGRWGKQELGLLPLQAQLLAQLLLLVLVQPLVLVQLLVLVHTQAGRTQPYSPHPWKPSSSSSADRN